MTIEFLQLLTLIIIANGAPIVIRVLLNNRFSVGVDFGYRLHVNHPIFGESKTCLGVIAAIVATSAAAWLMGYSFFTGVLVDSYAVLGVLISSFIKRRLARQPISMALLLDQIPESLFPALMMMQIFKLDISAIIQLVLTFIIIELLLSHILYKWGIREKPY